MLYIRPHLGVTFLADYNSWNVNATLNFRTVRQMLRLLSQLASDNVLAQPSVRFSVGLLRTKFQVTNFYLQVHEGMVEENRMYQELQNICSEKVCHTIVFRANLWKLGQNILCNPKQLPAPRPTHEHPSNVQSLVHKSRHSFSAEGLVRATLWKRRWNGKNKVVPSFPITVYWKICLRTANIYKTYFDRRLGPNSLINPLPCL